MVDFIVNNYLVIMIVALFLIFALIGFAVDTAKNKKNNEKELLTEPNSEEVPDNIALEDNENNAEDVSEQEPVENEIPEADSINMNMDN